MLKTDSEADKPVRLRDRLRGEATRAILDAAEEVFSEEGLGARMERIAARAGVAVGTLYNHFEDRQALADALAASRRGALLTRLDQTLETTEGRPFREQLQAFLAAAVEHGRAHERYFTMLVQSGAAPVCGSVGKSILTDLTARADRLVARGVATGEVRAAGSEEFGLLLIGMIRAAKVQALEGGTTWDRVNGPLLEVFLRGVQP